MKRVVVKTVVVSAIVWLASVARAQDVFAVPHPCIGWWAVDPAAAGAKGPAAPERLAAAVARLVTADQPVGPETPALVAAVLAGSLECGVANRVVLVNVAGEPDDRGQAWTCRGLSFVVEVEGESGEFERAIRAAASGAGGVRDGSLELPGGLTGRWFDIGGRPEWQRVEVASGGRGTLVGLGTGVLAAWLKPDDGIGAVATLQRTARGQAGRQAFEVLLDLDRLRSAVPARFSQGRVGRELEAIGLANARAFSFGVSAGAENSPAIAASWAVRSEPLERAIGVSLSGEVRAPEEGWGWSVGVKPSVQDVTDRSLKALRAWRTRFGMTEFDRALERWIQSPKTRGALNVVGMGRVDVRLGVGPDGLLRAWAVLPKVSAEDVGAAVASLPGAAEKGPGKWEVPVLGAADDLGGVLRKIEFSAVAEGDRIVVEVRAAGP